MSSAQEEQVHPSSHWHCLAQEHCDTFFAVCEQPQESVCGVCGTTFSVEEHPQVILDCMCLDCMCIDCFCTNFFLPAEMYLRETTEPKRHNSSQEGHGAPFIMCQKRLRSSEPPRNAKSTHRVTVLGQRHFRHAFFAWGKNLAEPRRASFSYFRFSKRSTPIVLSLAVPPVHLNFAPAFATCLALSSVRFSPPALSGRRSCGWGGHSVPFGPIGRSSTRSCQAPRPGPACPVCAPCSAQLGR